VRLVFLSDTCTDHNNCSRVCRVRTYTISGDATYAPPVHGVSGLGGADPLLRGPASALGRRGSARTSRTASG